MKMPQWWLWAIIVLQFIALLMLWGYTKESSSYWHRTGYEAGLEQGQWDYVNRTFHSQQLWETAQVRCE